MGAAKLVVKEGYNRGAVLPLQRDPVRLGRDETCDVRLLDPEASRDHAVITGFPASPVLEDRNSRNGVFVNGVRCLRKPLMHGDEIRIGGSVFLFLLDSGHRDSQFPRHGLDAETVSAPPVSAPGDSADAPKPGFPAHPSWRQDWKHRAPDLLVGASPKMLRIASLIHKVAPTEVPVLITGESGTGKELVAQALHINSPRRDGPFVPVNAAALPETLLESELFGHEKGAFTGAVARRTGRFEEADGGTLFLDEIGESALSAQAKLLRALEEGTIRRVGSEAPVPVNVRLIAATNRDPVQAVKDGQLREDLYYRLKGFEMQIPPLRARKEDVPDLARFFFERFRTKLPTRLKGFAKSCLDQLAAYPWPGNVRELKNVVERAMIVAEGPDIESGDLPPEVRGNRAREEDPGMIPLHDMERRLLLKALRLSGGNKSRAAALLGIHRKTLYSKMKVHGIQ
ncbi:MAG: sigma 54-interacting transcriptional regulator [Planctomycetota bacterium]|jgi:DNA-binding NtrC family response regulator